MNQLPMEDFLELYTETAERFFEIRKQMNSNDAAIRKNAEQAAEELRLHVKMKIKQLYQNIGADFSKEVSNITKQTNESSIII